MLVTLILIVSILLSYGKLNVPMVVKLVPALVEYERVSEALFDSLGTDTNVPSC